MSRVEISRGCLYHGYTILHERSFLTGRKSLVCGCVVVVTEHLMATILLIIRFYTDSDDDDDILIIFCYPQTVQMYGVISSHGQKNRFDTVYHSNCRITSIPHSLLLTIITRCCLWNQPRVQSFFSRSFWPFFMSSLAFPVPLPDVFSSSNGLLIDCFFFPNRMSQTH